MVKMCQQLCAAGWKEAAGGHQEVAGGHEKGDGGVQTVTVPPQVGQGYPHDPPKVKCETMVYHPNIDLEGNVCLNILREDWKPVLTINSIIYGLQYLFLVSRAWGGGTSGGGTHWSGLWGQLVALGCFLGMPDGWWGPRGATR
uniref:UBC core domain-containing protein n=1 Tax=Pavo cristatus TaxID=9049 RepID=A0A8C9FVR4_PAVCR